MSLLGNLWAKVKDTGKKTDLSLAWLVLAAVVPLLVFGSGVAWMIVGQKKTAVAEELANTARALQVAVDRELVSQFSAMDVLATDITLDRGDIAGFNDRARRVTEANKNWRNAVLIDPQSHKIVASGLPLPPSAPSTQAPAAVDEVVRTRNHLIVGAFVSGVVSKKPVIMFMSPVVRNNEVRYILAVVMNPKPFSDVFTEQRLKKSWTGAVLDSTLKLAGRSRHPERYFGVRATPSLSERITSSESGMFTSLNQEGDSVYTVYSRSPLTGWTVALGLPAAEVEGPISRTLLKISITGGSLIAFALLLTGMVGRSIVLRRNIYEQKFKDSESRFRLMADSAPVFIWLTDKNNVLIWFNQTALAFTGRSLEQESGAGWLEAVHPDDFQLCSEQFALHAGRRERFGLEFRFRRYDGHYRWIYDTGVPRFDEAGNFLGYIGSGFDISERKQAEAEKEQYYKFFNTSADLMAIADPNGAFYKTNPACTEVLGFTEQELVAKPFIDFVYPEDRQPTLDEMARQIEISYSLNFENRYVCKDGSIKWLSWRATFVKSEGITYATARDITERKHQEETIRRSEYEFRQLAEAMPQIVWVTRADGWNIYFNKQWVDYTGQTLEESYGHGWNKPFHPDDQLRAWDAWQVATNNGTNYALECRLRRADGVYRWWLIRGVPVLDEGGNISKWFGTCTDIDTIKNTEEQLLHAKLAAETANIAKSQFLANMSHEIRTPMNGVLGMTQLLEMTELSAEQSEFVTSLKMSGKNLLELINNILDLSKIEAGKVVLESGEFNLVRCINDIVLMHKHLAYEKGLILNVDHDEDIPPVLVGDCLHIRQILHNLLGNAIKFTSQGSITISVQVSEKMENSVLMQIAVRDTGIGIEPEAQQMIFMPFVQEDGSTTRKYGGTGLGLTISRRLAELMGGNISVESSPGAGSCFTMTLPFVMVMDQATALELPVPTDVCWPGPSLRILLVEDDRINITFESSLLRKLGHEVTVAEDGRECLAALEQGDYDLVLMDIQMPVMNGDEAVKAIRSREKVSLCHLRVIALTSYTLSGDKELFLQEGFDGYLSKPLEAVELVAEMKRVLAL